MSAGLTWQQSPEVLIKGLQDYQEKCLTAVYAVALDWGQRIQDAARRNARWEDRTGNARSGLFFAVDGFGLEPIVGQVTMTGSDAAQGEQASISGKSDQLVVVLSHTMWYGKFLELSHGGSYAIILSTIEANLFTLEAMLKGLFG